MGTVGPAQTLTWPNSCVYLPPTSTASIVGKLIFSDIPQMQGLPSRLWGFNQHPLRLHREISLPLLWSHHPWSSAFVLAPPKPKHVVLVCGPPSGVCSPPRQEGAKAAAALGTLTHSGWGEGGIAVTTGFCRECLQWQRPAGSYNSLRHAVHSPREVGPRLQDSWQWRAAEAPRKVWAVTCAWSQDAWLQ